MKMLIIGLILLTLSFISVYVPNKYTEYTFSRYQLGLIIITICYTTFIVGYYLINLTQNL